jgi:hypothetical protein
MMAEPFPYKDAVLEVAREAIAAGIVPSAVEELCARVSQEVRDGKWRQVNGEPMYTGAKIPQEPNEYVGAVLQTHPHYLLSQDATDHAELAFGERPTLKARGDFIKLYGQEVYKRTMQQWHCDDTLKPGTRPGPDIDANGKEKPAPGSSTNPWAKHFNGDDAARNAKIASIITTMGTKKAAEFARAAGTTIGRPLH